MVAIKVEKVHTIQDSDTTFSYLSEKKCSPMYKEASAKNVYGHIVYSSENLKTTYLTIYTENKYIR